MDTAFSSWGLATTHLFMCLWHAMAVLGFIPPPNHTVGDAATAVCIVTWDNSGLSEGGLSVSLDCPILGVSLDCPILSSLLPTPRQPLWEAVFTDIIPSCQPPPTACWVLYFLTVSRSIQYSVVQPLKSKPPCRPVLRPVLEFWPGGLSQQPLPLIFH